MLKMYLHIQGGVLGPEVLVCAAIFVLISIFINHFILPKVDVVPIDVIDLGFRTTVN